MNLRRACEHGRYDTHYVEIEGAYGLRTGALCPGGTEPTTDELLAMIFKRLEEEGLTDKEIGYRIGQALGQHLAAITEEGE